MAKGMEITIQAMLAIFMMIFVTLVLITTMKGRTTTLAQREHFDSYAQVHAFLVSFLSNPRCINIGSEANLNRQVPVAAVLERGRLDSLDRKNADLWCIQQGDFLYTVKITDAENKRVWLLGAAASGISWEEQQIGTSLPVVIRYRDQSVHVGRAALTAYFGPEAQLYSAVRHACQNQESSTVIAPLAHPVSYNSTTRKYCIAGECFTSSFSCVVKSFSIQAGARLHYLYPRNRTITVSS